MELAEATPQMGSRLYAVSGVSVTKEFMHQTRNKAAGATLSTSIARPRRRRK